jgi:hypothetical protein
MGKKNDLNLHREFSMISAINEQDRYLDRLQLTGNSILVVFEFAVEHNSLVERYLARETMVHKQSTFEYECNSLDLPKMILMVDDADC